VTDLLNTPRPPSKQQSKTGMKTGVKASMPER
jgi:hypothetical protein